MSASEKILEFRSNVGKDKSVVPAYFECPECYTNSGSFKNISGKVWFQCVNGHSNVVE